VFAVGSSRKQQHKLTHSFFTLRFYPSLSRFPKVKPNPKSKLWGLWQNICRSDAVPRQSINCIKLLKDDSVAEWRQRAANAGLIRNNGCVS